MEGTLINAGAVILGSIAGLIIHSRLPKNIVSIVFQGIGLFTLFLGIKKIKVLNMIPSLIIVVILAYFFI
jgi:uncharacterized membrane protein YqgA involved in biofilm formation